MTRKRKMGFALQLFRGRSGSGGMNTALKILLGVVLVVVAIKLLPVLLVPVGLGLLALVVVGGLLLAGVLAVAGTGLAAVAVVLAIVVAVAAALSPVWIPVLAVIGLIALIRRSRRVKTPAPVKA